MGSTALFSNSKLSDLMPIGHESKCPPTTPPKKLLPEWKASVSLHKRTNPQQEVFIYNCYKHMSRFLLFCFRKRRQAVHVNYHNAAGEITRRWCNQSVISRLMRMFFCHRSSLLPAFPLCLWLVIVVNLILVSLFLQRCILSFNLLHFPQGVQKVLSLVLSSFMLFWVT